MLIIFVLISKEFAYLFAHSAYIYINMYVYMYFSEVADKTDKKAFLCLLTEILIQNKEKDVFKKGLK